MKKKSSNFDEKKKVKLGNCLGKMSRYNWLNFSFTSSVFYFWLKWNLITYDSDINQNNSNYLLKFNRNIIPKKPSNEVFHFKKFKWKECTIIVIWTFLKSNEEPILIELLPHSNDFWLLSFLKQNLILLIKAT